jgi:hypothetical protein
MASDYSAVRERSVTVERLSGGLNVGQDINSTIWLRHAHDEILVGMVPVGESSQERDQISPTHVITTFKERAYRCPQCDVEVIIEHSVEVDSIITGPEGVTFEYPEWRSSE